MGYNPDKASSEEKWNWRMRELKEFLDQIPHTRTQRMMIDHHLSELFEILKEAAPTVIIDHSKNGLL